MVSFFRDRPERDRLDSPVVARRDGNWPPEVTEAGGAPVDGRLPWTTIESRTPPVRLWKP